MAQLKLASVTLPVLLLCCYWNVSLADTSIYQPFGASLHSRTAGNSEGSNVVGSLAYPSDALGGHSRSLQQVQQGASDGTTASTAAASAVAARGVQSGAAIAGAASNAAADAKERANSDAVTAKALLLRTQGPLKSKPAKKHAYAAICSIFKNEHDHVHEWIYYHQWIGVGKFYIFDHGSSPPMAVTLKEWVEAGVVEIFYFTNSWQLDLAQDPRQWIGDGRDFLSPQAWAYDNCFKWFSHRHKFIALMDADEYVILRAASPYRPDLPAFLKAYEPYGGLMIHWQVMGPSGHRSRPSGGTLESYTQCASREDMQSWREFQVNPIGFMKSFTNTQYAAGKCNPHRCSVRGRQYVNEDFQPLGGDTVRRVHWDKIVIFHYVTRSGQEYAKKLSRGSGHSQFSQEAQRLHIKSRGWGYFHMINQTSKSTCLEGTWMHRLCFEEGQQETYSDA